MHINFTSFDVLRTHSRKILDSTSLDIQVIDSSRISLGSYNCGVLCSVMWQNVRDEQNRWDEVCLK